MIFHSGTEQWRQVKNHPVWSEDPSPVGESLIWRETHPPVHASSSEWGVMRRIPLSPLLLPTMWTMWNDVRPQCHHCQLSLSFAALPGPTGNGNDCQATPPPPDESDFQLTKHFWGCFRPGSKIETNESRKQFPVSSGHSRSHSPLLPMVFKRNSQIVFRISLNMLPKRRFKMMLSICSKKVPRRCSQE